MMKIYITLMQSNEQIPVAKQNILGKTIKSSCHVVIVPKQFK